MILVSKKYLLGPGHSKVHLRKSSNHAITQSNKHVPLWLKRGKIGSIKAIDMNLMVLGEKPPEH